MKDFNLKKYVSKNPLLESIPMTPGKSEMGDDGEMHNVKMSNSERKMALRNVLDVLGKHYPELTVDDKLDFITTHSQDFFNGNVDPYNDDEIKDEYQEYFIINSDTPSMNEVEIEDELEIEDMEDPDEDLVIIGSGYLDIKSNFGERPSQTNGEYAELGQKVVDQLHNGDKEAAIDYIMSQINEGDKEEIENIKRMNPDTNTKSLDKLSKMGEKETTVGVQKLKEGVWEIGNPDDIKEFIAKAKQLKNVYWNVVGSDDVMDGMDTAIRGAEELLDIKLDLPPKYSTTGLDEKIGNGVRENELLINLLKDTYKQ